MRHLLAVLNHVETAPVVLAAARWVARRLPGARIDVLHVRPASDPSFMPTEEIMTPARRAQFEANAAARSAALRGIFDAWRGEAGADLDAAWREETGEQAAVVGRECGEVDLVLIGRGLHHAAGDGHAAIQAALFAAGAPMILVPQAVPATLGAHIAIAWKPGETAERAVVAATPLLRAAERVTVLIGAESGDQTPPPPVLSQALAGRTLVADMHRFAMAGDTIGPALLRAARDVGADLLVMGAYEHRRSTELLLGGATREILAEADLPVFLHH